MKTNTTSNIGNSLRWSTAGEVLSKLITPVTNMILARVLAPEDFGVLATINMIITFVDLFTDSGFAKYIIQHDFKNNSEVKEYINVAFWTNLGLSIFLWFLIYLFRFPIAHFIGNSGSEAAIVLASTQIIVTSFSSIQISLHRRYFDFKILFKARLLTAIIPLCVTVPLALLLQNYWALVIGSILLHVINAIYLTLKSSWKPYRYYSFAKLKEMLSFSVWSLAEAVAYWFTTWFDVLVIGAAFSTYLLGLYKNSLNMVNSLMMLIKASFIPVLFSSLSRLKDSPSQFSSVYKGLQFGAACLLIPMGVGIFIFRDFITLFLLGSQWSEAANIVGVWGLSSCIMAVFVNFNAEAYKAKGIPQVLFFYEIVCLILMIICCSLAKQYGFWPFVYVRSASVLIQVILGFYFMKRYVQFSIREMVSNLLPPAIGSICMGICGYFLRQIFISSVWQIISILLCIGIYLFIMWLLFRKKITKAFKIIQRTNTTSHT